MPANFPLSFEESNYTRKHAIELWLLENVDKSQPEKRHVICFLNNTSFYTTSFPDFHKWQPNFKSRVLMAMVDGVMKESLVKHGLINWCANVRSLVPLVVPRDENSLLHALATAVWGITDSSKLLRRFLCLALGLDQDCRFQSRWLYHRQRQISQYVDRLFESGKQVMSDEWTELQRCLDPEHSHSVAIPDHVLEPIHVYALANILRRPIIIMADSSAHSLSGRSLQDPQMGGIYLPLEWSWTDTCRVPVLLGCLHDQFAPLLFTDYPNRSLAGGPDTKRDLVPLVSSLFEQLPVRLLLHGEEPHVGELLRKYLRVRETVMCVNQSLQNVLCAEVEALSLPAQLNIVTDFITDCILRFQQDPKSAAASLHAPVLAPQDWTVVKKEHGQSTATHHSPGLAPGMNREELQRANTPQFGLRDPTLPNAGEDAQHQIHIPPPTLKPMMGLLEKNLSLNPPPEKACKTPSCRFFGDPALGMMCSTCFKNFTIQESRQMAVGARPHPSAPLVSMSAEQMPQLSMMREKCRLNCGYYCSTMTYPYCHECANKVQKKAHEEAMAAAFNEATFAPRDTEQLAEQSGNGVGAGSVPAQMPAESGEGAGNIDPNTMLTPQSGPSAREPPAKGGASEMRDADPAPVSQKSASVPSAQPIHETLTQATGDPPCSVTPSTEDSNPMLLFGSGLDLQSSHHGQVQSEPQAAAFPIAPMSSAQGMGDGQNSLQSETAVQSQQNHHPASSVELTSTACLAKNHHTPPCITASSGAEAPAMCANKDCKESVLRGPWCAKCFVGQDIRSTDMEALAMASLTYQKPTEPVSIMEQKVQVMSLLSTSSSAPPSMGPTTAPVGPVLPKSNATYTKETGAYHQQESRSQPSSLRDLRNIPQMNYTQTWIQDNLFAETPLPHNNLFGAKSPPLQGLPEKPESEGLGNDLIASGAGCFSSTQRCIAEGCGNAVAQAGKLCQQCHEILQHARRSQGISAAFVPVAAISSSSFATQAEQHCRTEGCRFYGAQQTQGYCTQCYRKLVEREVEERHIPVAQRTISVPPEFCHMFTFPEQQGKPCSSVGCSLFGDPGQSDMCVRHFQQHLASISKATLGLNTAQSPNITAITCGSSMFITPTSGTCFRQGDVLPLSQVSVPPPSFPGSSRSQEPSLGETYYRVAGQHTSTCLNTTCSNFGNSKKGGLCNSCALDQKSNDDLICRAICGDEEIG